MRQLSPVQAPEEPGPGAQWWAATIEPAGRDLSDAVLREIVTPLATTARSWGAWRWFFTRSIDPVHPSVQVRILASPPTVERLQPLMRALVDRAGPGLGDLQRSETLEDPIPVRGATGSLSPRAEAELAKYGGAEGVALAEEVFELSSDLAAWAASRFPKPNTRSSVAALLLFDAGYAMMRGPRSGGWADRRRISWGYYWDSHLHSCTAPAGLQAGHLRAALISQAAPRIMPVHRLMAATASEPAVDNWRKRWTRTIDTYLYRADKARVSRSALDLTMYQSRLMMNRLGISVHEEAGLGLYAQSWSKLREEDFLNGRSAPL